MRNILNIDLTNSNCDGVYSSDCNNNCSAMILNVEGLELTNPYLLFTFSDATTYQTDILEIENDEIYFDVPDMVFNRSDSIKVVLKADNSYASETININTVAYTSSDTLICKYSSGKFVFSLYSTQEPPKVIDNLESTSTTDMLSANMGRELNKNKLDKMVVSKVLKTAGWYRVAKFNDATSNALSFIANINTRFNNYQNISITLAVNLCYSKAKITNISSAIGNPTINKARLVKENNETYLEIYYNISLENFVSVDILHQNVLQKELSMLNFEAPTSTATVLDEIEIGEMTITNSNGTAIKFSDGTMICTKTVSLTGIPISSADGNLYVSSAHSLGNYAKEFIEAPVLQVTTSRGSTQCFIYNVSSVGKNSIGIVIFARGSSHSNATINVEVTAIGRWK